MNETLWKGLISRIWTFHFISFWCMCISFCFGDDLCFLFHKNYTFRSMKVLVFFVLRTCLPPCVVHAASSHHCQSNDLKKLSSLTYICRKNLLYFFHFFLEKNWSYYKDEATRRKRNDLNNYIHQMWNTELSMSDLLMKFLSQFTPLILL